MQTDIAPLKLSPRQQQLLDLLAQGYRQREIAALLGISVGTVRHHLYVLYARLDVEGKHQAVLAAIERGLVTVEGKGP